jgi:hypothetical protein
MWDSGKVAEEAIDILKSSMSSVSCPERRKGTRGPVWKVTDIPRNAPIAYIAWYYFHIYPIITP